MNEPSHETAAEGQRDAPEWNTRERFFCPTESRGHEKAREGVDKQEVQSYDWKVRLTGTKPVAEADSRGAPLPPTVFRSLDSPLSAAKQQKRLDRGRKQ